MSKKKSKLDGIRLIEEEEQYFIGSLFELAEDERLMFGDLNRDDFSSTFGWELYSICMKKEYPYDSLLELKRNEKITPDEYTWILEDFGIDSSSLDLRKAQQMYYMIRASRTVKNIQKIYSIAIDQSMNNSDKLSEMQTLLDLANSSNSENVSAKSLKDFIEELDDKGVEPDYMFFGYPNLDSVLNIKHDNLIVIAARPSVGKTAFSMSVMIHNAKQAKRSLFYSLEMGGLEQAERSLKSIQDKEIANDILIVDAASITIPTIIRDFHRYKPDFIVIDQLNKVEAKGTGMFERTTNAIREIKKLTKKLKVPIIVLAQVNRAGEEMPNLTNLKETGAIEEDADKVIILHRDRENEDTKNHTTLKLAKNRQGKIGIEELEFIEDLVTFREKRKFYSKND